MPYKLTGNLNYERLLSFYSNSIGHDVKKVIIYTDGASRGNPGHGGWGALLICDGHEKELCGYQADATNNQMELTAAIKALEALKNPCEVVLYTDSKYVKQGLTEWMSNWKKNNWKTAAKKPVKNKELWIELDELAQKHQIDWHWVKGHNGDAGNERADALANKGIDEKNRGI